MTTGTPLVTIGLPVRNGAAFVEHAIESVLAQDFPDWELVICDNASEDATGKICRRYVGRNPRVRYHRSPVDLGATQNHNRVLALALGQWFKWLAHDDVLYPGFIRRSLEALRADPGAVLAYSAIDIIDAAGRVMYRDPAILPQAQGRRAPARFADAILIPHNCLAFFGLAPTEVLRRLRLSAFDGADRALIAELALVGRFAYVPDALWANRDHPGRYIRAVRPHPHTSMGWWDTAAQPTTLHYWRLWQAYHRAVAAHVPPGRERLACRAHLARWLLADWQWAHLAVDAAGTLDARVFALARRAKQRLFPPVPPGRERA